MAVTLDTLKKTVGKKKVKSMAFAWLADYENMAGDVDNALARVEAGLKTYPGDIPGMLVRSKILFQKGDFEECIKECERVLEKEPFCLSAQKRMGEAYEQLENTVERNHCFRRVHDMDPLDTFWKEEYEAEPEENVAVAAGAVAGAAADAMGDVDFAMPDLGDMNQPQAEENAELALDTVTAEPAAEPQAEEKPAEEDNLFSKSLDMDIDAPAEETAPAKSASPFSSLGEDEDPFAALASLGGEDNSVEESAMDSLQQSLDSAIAEAGNETVDQEIPAGEEISGNDVGSAFADLFGEEDDLDSFGETTSTSAPAAETKEPANASPFAQFDLPSSLDDEPEQPKENVADNTLDEVTEDKPQSIDDAFGDIFGEDELPEELPSTKPAAQAEPEQTVDLNAWSPEPASEGGLFEKSAASDMGFDLAEDKPADKPADKPQSLDSAFADIFGEDELPEELPPSKPAEEPELKPFEESLSLDDSALTLDEPALETPAAEPALDVPDELSMELPPENAKEPELKPFEEGLSLDDSALTLDEPALETPAETSTELSADEMDIANWTPGGTPAEETENVDLEVTQPAVEEPAAVEPADEKLTIEEPAVEETAAEETPAEETVAEETVAEPAVEDVPVEPAVEEPATVEPADEELTIEEPAVEETAAEEPAVAETPVEAAPAEETNGALDGEGFGIDKAFDALFAEEDELPEEHATPAAETADADKVTAEDAAPEISEDKPEEGMSASEKEELDKEMGDAFSSLFADDDDLAVDETKSAETAPTEEDTGAALEEAPLADAALEADLDKSFSSLFGEDDALEETPAEAPAADAASAATEAPAETDAAIPELTSNSTDLESLESEFSGAFKQLFNTDDDSLDETTVPPSNKGVDFLMSGDSDDEVTAGLVTDPTAPLDKLPPDIDESLNTQTLAEIYFEQGYYDKALDIYKDLSSKDPENEAIAKRLAEVEKAYDAKFGGGANGRS